jgi:hypothetical protein
MAFNISDWLLRRRIDAQVRTRTSGGPAEHRRIGNPYHAVSIEVGTRCCEAAREREGQRFLSTEAPMLPLVGCTQTSCQCRYVHHDDRRLKRDRRVQFPNPHALRNGDRRTGGGRRITD